MMNIYLPLVDRALIVDNSSTILTEKGYSIIAEKVGEALTVRNEALWKEIKHAGQ